jgi:hypothetical protein
MTTKTTGEIRQNNTKSMQQQHADTLKASGDALLRSLSDSGETSKTPKKSWQQIQQEQNEHLKASADVLLRAAGEKTEAKAENQPQTNHPEEGLPAVEIQKTTKLFKDRADLDNLDDLLDVVDSVSQMALRAKGILQILSIKFVEKPCEEDQAVFWALDAAMLEIDDIRNLIAAHHTAIRSTGGEQ